jgi:signal peptide peptidase SppA
MAIGSYLLNNLCSETWFIKPETLKMYEQVFNSKYIDNEKMQTIIGEYDKQEQKNSLLDVHGSKAILNIEGTLLRKAGFLDALCGVIGMNELQLAAYEALTDNSIDHLILNFDTPGGSALGTPEFAEMIYSMRSSKRITSLVSGQMCSAGIFIGAAAHEIYSTSPINDIGSIGVVAMHVDQSKADAEEGLKYTYIYSGKHKIDGNPHEALTPQALADIQNKLDYSYGVFLDSVAKYRGITSDELSKFAEGQVFKAGQLMNSPLLDGMSTLDEILRS